MTLRVSPSEPPSLRAIGRTTNMPELYGADILFPSRLGLVAVQRKEAPGDFLASVHDGRLSEQFARMQRAAVRVLVLEGRMTWTTEGELVVNFGPGWTRRQHQRFLWSARLQGVWVDWTDSLQATIDWVRDFEEWANKPKHGTGGGRPKPKAAGGWGTPSSREWGSHLLQSFDGVGADMAGRIYDHFGGVPLAWTVTREEMAAVHGVGPRRIAKMFDGLGAE